jgi:hypothetical protein
MDPAAGILRPVVTYREAQGTHPVMPPAPRRVPPPFPGGAGRPVFCPPGLLSGVRGASGPFRLLGPLSPNVRCWAHADSNIELPTPAQNADYGATWEDSARGDEDPAQIVCGSGPVPA